MSLKDYRLLPKTKVQQLVVLLHGVGANGEDLLDLGQLWQTILPDCAFISPDGSEAYDMAPMGRQWFSLRERDPAAMLRGIQRTQPIVDAYLDNLLKEFSLPASKLALVGFSQGTMLSLYVGPRRAQQIAGIMAYSGALLGSETFGRDIKSKPPVCLVHGLLDDVVPVVASQMAQQVLQKEGFQCELHLRERLGHSIDDGGLKLGAAFLQRILA